MARSVNQVILMGNLTRDPELRQTPSGQTVCNFGIALNRAYKNQSGEWQEATDFVNCVAWGPLGERIGQYLHKGSRALVQGTLRSSSWEQDGQKRSKLEVWANDVTFLDGRGGDGEGGGSSAPSSSNSSGSSSSKKKDDKDDVVEDVGDEPINLDDIPF
jgi:single-strand DNA-binding protein